MRLEKRPHSSSVALVLAPLGAVVFTLLISALLVLWAGAPVAQTYGLLFKGGFGSVFALSETLTRAIPLMLTGLAAAVAFKARLFNIGAEGQLYVGALAAVAVGGLHGGTGFDLPPALLFVLMMLAATLAGALLLLGPALMKAKLGVDEVVTTLLLNFIVLLGVSMMLDVPMNAPTAMGWPQRVALISQLDLSKLVAQTRFPVLYTHLDVYKGQAQWMVGHAIDAPVRHPAKTVGDAVCVLNKACTAPGRERLKQVSLTLHSGEIVAIAGVSGNGQVALAELLCGTRHATAGEVRLLGHPLPQHPAELVALGVARIPEDRHAVGVVGDLPVWVNAVSERLRSPIFSTWGWVRRTRALQYAKRVMKTFDVRGGGPLVAARALSGGNMQKLILGRALMHPAQIAIDLIVNTFTNDAATLEGFAPVSYTHLDVYKRQTSRSLLT